MARLGLAPIVLLALTSLLLGVAGKALVTAQVSGIQAVYVDGDIPLDPSSDFWAGIEKVEIALVAQNVVYPLVGEGEPRSLSVAAAVSKTGMLAIYLEWEDPTRDVPVPGGIDVFPDQVAVQFPVSNESLPYICMGTTEQPVSIVLWKAPDRAETLVAGSAYGMNPDEREALGLQASPTSPIELLPPEAQIWGSKAVYSDGKWRVVLYRPLSSTHPLVTNLSLGSEVSVAFAVWQGSEREAGGLKSTSAWYTLSLAGPAAEVVEPPAETATQTETVLRTVTETEVKGGLGLALAGFIVGVLLYTLAVAAYVYLIKPRR